MLGVDAHRGLAEKEAAQFDGIILAVGCVTAQAVIDDPMVAGLLDEMLDHLRGQDHFLRPVNLFVDLDDSVHGQVENVIAIEEHAVDETADDR